MKVVMAAWRFHPHIGGVERHVWEVSQRLLGLGCEITVVTERYAEDLPAHELLIVPEGKLEVLRVASWRGRRSHLDPARWRTLGPALRAMSQADLVHFHDFGPFVHWFEPFSWWIRKPRRFVTFHGWEGIFPPAPETIRVRARVEHGTRGNLCIGDFIPKWYGTTPSGVSYGGVEIPRGGPPSAPAPNAPGLFLGRLAEDSGILIVLEALAILARQGVHLPVRIAGDGPLRSQAEAFCQENGLDACFLGWVREPFEEIDAARMVFTSGYLGILESMAHGRLTAACYDNPLKEDYLRLMPVARHMLIAGSPVDLAECLIRTLRDGAVMAAMCQASQNWAQSQSWDMVAHQYLDLWRTT